MSLFEITPTRHIDIEHIADIKYTPAGGRRVIMPRGSREGNAAGGISDIHFPVASQLRITLKSSEVIELDGEQADAVWKAYQKAGKRRATKISPRRRLGRKGKHTV